jgi:hypothetical protein
MRPIRTLAFSVLIAALLGVLWLPGAVHSQPVISSAQRLANLEAAVSALTQTVANLQAANAAQATSIANLQTALTKEAADRKTYADAAGTSALNGAKAYSDSLTAPLADKLTHFSRNGNEIFITGANLNIRNGTGYTYQQINGLGNLIIGYNELRTGANTVNTRSGSHNLILGFNQNYSQAGALMLGAANSSTGHFASVLGGTGNISGGLYAVVVGGYDNQATGNWSTVLGGRGVRATAVLDHVP